MLTLQVKDHGILIAIRELDALDTVTPDFVGQFRFIDQMEAVLAEEIRLVGQAEDTFQTDLARFESPTIRRTRKANAPLAMRSRWSTGV